VWPDLEDIVLVFGGRGRGDSSVGVTWPSEGESSSTGKEGRDLSNESIGDAALLPKVGVFAVLLRFRRRAIIVS
jgi:hypothetical protein